MKINIECESLVLKSEYSLEENGLLALLNNFNNHGVIELNEIIGNNNPEHVMSVLKKLVKKNVFNINETNENDSLVINIINGSVKKRSKIGKLSKNKKIQFCYQLDEPKFQTIVERSSDNRSFKLNLVTVCFDNYKVRDLPITELNSKEQFIELMDTITPFELIVSHGKQLTRRDFDQVYDILVAYEFELAIINFAIDYAITNSIYNNLSYQFVTVLLDSWKKHNISDVGSAMNLVKKQKEAGIKKSSRYVKPEYEQPSAENSMAVDVKNLFTGDDSFE